METLKISLQKAIELYPNASTEFKVMLEETFGISKLSGKITDRVKTFEDACAIVGEDADDVANFLTGEPDEIAYRKLKVIARALNEGWKPDWNNSNQRKWYPWFYLNNPGFRFYVSYCAFAFTYSSGGSQLCFSSEELATYAGNQFIELYNHLLN